MKLKEKIDRGGGGRRKSLVPWIRQSTFSHSQKVDNNDINANSVFPYICSFCHDLYLKILVIVKLDVSWQKGLPFRVPDFFGLINFEWQGQNKVGNIAILVLSRDREKL